jgi:hypothetical protein
VSFRYDGKDAGEFIGDAARRISGTIGGFVLDIRSGRITQSGALYWQYNSTIPMTGYVTSYSGEIATGPAALDSARSVPVANENRPASISGMIYMTY